MAFCPYCGESNPLGRDMNSLIVRNTTCKKCGRSIAHS
jgi:ribosomal protein S27AE